MPRGGRRTGANTVPAWPRLNPDHRTIPRLQTTHRIGSTTESELSRRTEYAPRKHNGRVADYSGVFWPTPFPMSVDPCRNSRWPDLGGAPTPPQNGDSVRAFYGRIGSRVRRRSSELSLTVVANECARIVGAHRQVEESVERFGGLCFIEVNMARCGGGGRRVDHCEKRQAAGGEACHTFHS